MDNNFGYDDSRKSRCVTSEELQRMCGDNFRTLSTKELQEALLNEMTRRIQVTFFCINKNVTMSVQELIDYYIDTESAKTAEGCGF